MNDTVEQKANKSLKWSFLSEVASKLTTPVVTMILARLLTPDAFGVVATINMIISLADMFANAGFYKYIIQSDIKDENGQKLFNVAFWTNFVLAIALWLIIIIFRNQLSALVGNPGLGNVLAVASISLVFAAIISIGTAFLVKDFNFKRVFLLRLINIIVPLFVTCPLAFWLRNYWALILGTLAMQVASAVVITYFIKFKPQFRYDFGMLKEIITFSFWAFLEQFLGWLNLYAGIFIVSIALTPYFVGVYKVAMGVVNQGIALVIGTLSPVLYTALSKVRYNDQKYNEIYFKFMYLLAMAITPIFVFILLYSDFITSIFLGNKWLIASRFIQIWAIARCFRSLNSAFFTEIFLSKGMPKIPSILQFVELCLLIVILYYSALSKDFDTICLGRSSIPILMGLVDLWALKKIIGVSVKKTFLTPLRVYFYGAIMALILYIFKGSLVSETFGLILGLLVYLILLLKNPKSKGYILEFINK